MGWFSAPTITFAIAIVWALVGCSGTGAKDPSSGGDDDTAIGLGQGGGAEEAITPAEEDVEVPPAP